MPIGCFPQVLEFFVFLFGKIGCCIFRELKQIDWFSIRTNSLLFSTRGQTSAVHPVSMALMPVCKMPVPRCWAHQYTISVQIIDTMNETEVMANACLHPFVFPFTVFIWSCVHSLRPLTSSVVVRTPSLIGCMCCKFQAHGDRQLNVTHCLKKTKTKNPRLPVLSVREPTHPWKIPYIFVWCT